jgi:cystathionine beta-lyase/cystathionine gamma-synthase
MHGLYLELTLYFTDANVSPQVHGRSSVKDPYGASAPPLWQTATFAQPGATTFGEYDYTRSGNPTRTMLEEQVRWVAREIAAL